MMRNVAIGCPGTRLLIVSDEVCTAGLSCSPWTTSTTLRKRGAQLVGEVVQYKDGLCTGSPTHRIHSWQACARPPTSKPCNSTASLHGYGCAQPTPELQTAEFETAKKWVDVAQKIGAGRVRVFGGSIPKGATEPQAINWAVEVFKRSAEYAGSKGIISAWRMTAGSQQPLSRLSRS